MLAHKWKGQDPTGWWVSEKYDGIRAIWDGKNFVSRNGNVFYAPAWFKAGMPSTPVDGELWAGRGMANFQDAVSIVRSHAAGDRWKKIRYLVFDLPESQEPFETVQRKLKKWVTSADLPYVQLVPQERVKSRADLDKRMEEALAVGAEGLMLREPGSKYTLARSHSLLKVKPTYDADAVITGYQEGTGKHRGRMGAVHAYLLDDPSKKFKIGTGFSDAERDDPPPIGSIVEFTFTETTKAGIPRHPAFKRVRRDLMKDERAGIQSLETQMRKVAKQVVKERQKATPKPKVKPAPSRAAQDFFSMSASQLVALQDAGARKELIRRGRDPATGRKRR